MINGHALRLHYLNSNPLAEISGIHKTEFYYNYISNHSSLDNFQRVKVFKGLQYSNLYPGIDARYYGKGEDLKYDFIVAPGADPDQIKNEI
jgi:hypothetical protein